MIDPDEHNPNNITLLAFARCKFKDSYGLVKMGQVAGELPQVGVCMSSQNSQIIRGLQFRIREILAVSKALQVVLDILGRPTILKFGCDLVFCQIEAKELQSIDRAAKVTQSLLSGPAVSVSRMDQGQRRTTEVCFSRRAVHCLAWWSENWM